MKRSLTLTLLMLFVFLCSSVVIARPEAPTQYVPIVVNQNELATLGRDYGWVEQASGFTAQSRGIHYMCTVNSDTVWATAYDGTAANVAVQEYTRTTNGGELWTAGEIPNADGLELAMIFASDANTAWAPLYKSSGSNLQGIYYTSNGGTNWTRLGETTMYNYSASFPNVVHFWDENNGFAQGDPVDGYYELYTTTDGGTNWTRVPSANIPTPVSGEFGIVGYYDVVGDTIWWGTNKGRVFKSVDKGYNWTVCNQVGSLTYVNIWFKDGMNGILQDKSSSNSGTLYETSDGGTNWTLINHTGTVYYNDISYVPGTDNMYVSTGADYTTPAMGASYSLDGGHTWTIYEGTDETQFLATDWANETCGYAGSFNTDQYTGGMFKYTYVPAPVLPPQNLVAEAQSDLTVDLHWSPPLSGLEGWIRWDNGTCAGYIGLENPAAFNMASKFDPIDMLPYDGGQITKIKFYPTSTTTTYTLAIWTGTNGTTVAMQQSISSFTVNSWNEVELTSPVDVDGSDTYWIGLMMNQVNAGEHPAAYDAGPSQNGLWAGQGSSWEDISSTYNYNWNIAAYIENSDGKVTPLKHQREVTSYKVYHSLVSGDSYDFIGSVSGTDTTFTHEEPATGTTNYYVVTAVHDEMDESEYSNEASAYVEIATAVEYAYDDGTAETGYCAGSAGSMLAVRITPDQYPVKLIRIKYYLTEVRQQLIPYVWDDDGTDGQPGTQLISPILTVPTSDLVANDWNVVTLPDDSRYNIVIEEGDFYVGWFEASNSSLIGVDTGGTIYNRSWQYSGGTWYDYNSGIQQNMMIRAIVDTSIGQGVDDDPAYGTTYLRQNYPNPVKGSTKIQYGIKNHQGPVEINIYNILGQKVDSIEGEDGVATWNPGDLPSGIYFYKLDTKEFTQTRKLLLIK